MEISKSRYQVSGVRRQGGTRGPGHVAGPSGVFPEPWHLTPGTWHLPFRMDYADPLIRAAPFQLGQFGLAYK